MPYPTWKQKRAAIKAAITQALKLGKARTKRMANGQFTPSHEVEWENERGAQRAVDKVWVDLRLGSVQTTMQDETRREYDPDTGRLLATYGGERRFTVSVLICTDDQTDVDAVGELAGLLRTRIQREDILDGLAEVNVGFTEIAASINADYEDNSRMVSCAMVDIRFETSEADEPTDTDSGDYINEVEMLGKAGGPFEGQAVTVGPVT